MTNNLKIEVLVSNIPEDGSIASQFPSQEYVNQQLAKKANLSPEGRLDPAQAPDYTEIPGLYEHIEDTKDEIGSSIALSLQDAKGYTNQQLSEGLRTKADLVNGKIPFDQIPFSADIEDQIQINVENITAVVDQKVAQVVEQVNQAATAANAYTDTKVAENKTYVDTAIGNVIEDVTTIVDTKTVSKAVTIPTYLTPEAGVASGSGVAAGAYFNVRSTDNDKMLIEYQNVGGSATPTGKSNPSSVAVRNIAKYTALPFDAGKPYGLHERVQLEHGVIVKSTIDGNTNNPNVDMTGWIGANNFSYVTDNNNKGLDLYIRYVSPEVFGAGQGSAAQDTQAWIDCINFASANNIEIYASGDYGLIGTTIHTPAYSGVQINVAVLVSGVDGLVINARTAKFTLDTGDTSSCISGFVFYQCRNTVINGMNSENTASMAVNRIGYGHFILFDSGINNSANFISGNNVRCVVNGYSEKGSTIFGGTATGNVGVHRGANYAFYASRDCVIDSVITYEGTYDGDVGLYGSCFNSTVKNCRVYNYQANDNTRTVSNMVAQGIFIDAGCQQCTVDGNTTYGHYYGIDVKTNCAATKVVNNTVFVGKVGIASRRGEANDIVWSTQISNNTIVFVDCNFSSGVIHTTDSGYTITRAAFFLQDSFGSVITNNTVTAEKITGNYTVSNAVIYYVKQGSDAIVDNTADLTIGETNLVQKQTVGATTSLLKCVFAVLSGSATATNKMHGVTFSSISPKTAIFAETLNVPFFEAKNLRRLTIEQIDIPTSWRGISTSLFNVENCSKFRMLNVTAPHVNKVLALKDFDTAIVQGNVTDGQLQYGTGAYTFENGNLAILRNNTYIGGASGTFKFAVYTNVVKALNINNVIRSNGLTTDENCYSQTGSTVVSTGNVFA